MVQPAKDPMRMLDLRQLPTRQIVPLLDEEAELWRNELHWDYRYSVELIKKFLDLHSLAGYVLLEDSRAAGYGFYVIEDRKGLLGSLFVSQRYPQQELGERLLREIVVALRATPGVHRLEMQLMPFGATLSAALSALGFRLYARQYMVLSLDACSVREEHPPADLRLERWQARFLDPSAELIQLSYAGHVDGDINDQYHSREGAEKFLKNIVMLPGCGQFEPQASWVLREILSGRLVGVVLTSMVAKGVGHTTQVCVLPEFRSRGLGKLLMTASVGALSRLRASELSLTVTSQNTQAVRLYERLGFQTHKTFVAGVWEDGRG
jgi:ribosomal protein S18 acetylase RimI-like enzyme